MRRYSWQATWSAGKKHTTASSVVLDNLWRISCPLLQLRGWSHLDDSKPGVAQGVVLVGGSGFTDAQFAAISGVVQELLKKALSRDQHWQ